MPRIFLKPNSPEFADTGKAKTHARCCEMPDCRESGEYRAPKNRELSDYYWFCQTHARDYNQAWNYFAGMSGEEIEDQIIQSYYGDRPTWRYDTEGAAEEVLRRTAWKTYNFTEREPPKTQHGRSVSRNTPEGEALAVMGLEPPVTLDEIKARYKELAKKHHPDVNRGSPESEELLKTINMAYTILKMAYEQFKVLPDID
jgi:hypothetical protein